MRQRIISLIICKTFSMQPRAVSFEEVDNDIVASIYKNVVANSVAYMMMSRLGVDTDGYFELDDFRDVTNFNTQETLNALGFATSDIAEMGLTESI